uniref:Heat shock transcription factor 1 n=1 Tax=Cynoglossus semilaevis TaxID=244447 RepID=A0A3P8WPL0_CYNSE
MEFPAGGAAMLPSGNVPAFLTKLWTLVEDPDTDPLICWSPSGTSFHVFDQGQFSKEVLPKYFKHNNMASFIRQLNMYGFRKVVHIEQGGLLKPERDDTEFQHPFFIRGEERLLENIKRKVTNVSAGRQEDVKLSSDEVKKILSNVQMMKGKQETIDSRINAMKHENEALWREVATLRQKHSQQQKVVNKLIQFLVSLVQSNRILGVKRKIPLMLNDSSSAHSVPKYSRPFTLQDLQAAAGVFSADAPISSGPIISDITEVVQPIVEEDSVNIKEEVPSPEVQVLECDDPPVDTPLSPTTFINAFLCDSSHAPNGQKCQTIACIDRSELSDHVDTMETRLENLQSVLNTQTFTFDTFPLLEVSEGTATGVHSLVVVVVLLCDDAAKGSVGGDVSDTGKQLVQYMATPLLSSDPVGVEEGGVDLPSLLQLDDEPFLVPDSPGDDPTAALLAPPPPSPPFPPPLSSLCP